MKKQHALYLAKHLMRRYDGGRDWNSRGVYIAQWLIPRAPKGMIPYTRKLMNREDAPIRVVTIPVSKIRSDQGCLRHRRLCAAIQRFSHSQRQIRYTPVLVYWRGRYLIWDGNHRVTAAMMLGKATLRCRVYYAR